MRAESSQTPSREFMSRLARMAAAIHRRYFRAGVAVSYKSRNNPVTRADREAEAVLKEYIHRRFPDDRFISEETCPDFSRIEQGTRYWIIDPLDGTVNFTHGVPLFSVSIACWRRGRVIAGVVYNPVSGEMFNAELGRGAWCNGRRVQVSRIVRLSDALLVTGFPYTTQCQPGRIFPLFRSFSMRSQAIRRLGCASLDMCWLAAGRFDGFWEQQLHPWDIAAGSLIVEEAGGRITTYAGSSDYLFADTIVVSNGRIHSEMLHLTSSR
jgi:myo-inositol-1(or 4)-monophosphatase